jgi:hypothetical protein
MATQTHSTFGKGHTLLKCIKPQPSSLERALLRHTCVGLSQHIWHAVERSASDHLLCNHQCQLLQAALHAAAACNMLPAVLVTANSQRRASGKQAQGVYTHVHLHALEPMTSSYFGAIWKLATCRTAASQCSRLELHRGLSQTAAAFTTCATVPSTARRPGKLLLESDGAKDSPSTPQTASCCAFVTAAHWRIACT